MMMFNSNDKTINFCQCYDDDDDDEVKVKVKQRRQWKKTIRFDHGQGQFVEKKTLMMRFFFL